MIILCFPGDSESENRPPIPAIRILFSPAVLMLANASPCREMLSATTPFHNCCAGENIYQHRKKCVSRIRLIEKDCQWYPKVITRHGFIKKNGFYGLLTFPEL